MPLYAPDIESVCIAHCCHAKGLDCTAVFVGNGTRDLTQQVSDAAGIRLLSGHQTVGHWLNS